MRWRSSAARICCSQASLTGDGAGLVQRSIIRPSPPKIKSENFVIDTPSNVSEDTPRRNGLAMSNKRRKPLPSRKQSPCTSFTAPSA
jgi:hypothetical protein